MASITNLSLHLSVLLFPIFIFSSVYGWNGQQHNHKCHHNDGGDDGSVMKKLFVFGDSYVDTGNLGNYAASWKEPYGRTFPGKPAGRFSDGLILTDYMASFLGIESPLPYEQRMSAKEYQLAHGLNFAFGGTGMFKTMVDSPNMTTQIDYFQQLLEQKVYTKNDLDSSVALVSSAGNDYTFFVLTNGTLADLPSVSQDIVKQLAINLKRLLDLGVRKIAVTGLEPMGCYPVFTGGLSCNTLFNNASQFHNSILIQAVAELKKEAADPQNPPTLLILDLYQAFNVSLNTEHHEGSLKFTYPLKQCCAGSSFEACGKVDGKGVKQYEVCQDPELFFFWDEVHPSQSGWHSVFELLKPSLGVFS